MSNTSQNNSSTSLMGFSVHQPSIGSPLQFFPAMGSKQLDEMIDAYVPGDAPITNKRATVSMEFFEHSMATGELFKFFMVYPSLGSATESPSSSMLDSGYGSSFTSPVMSESQWTQSGSASLLPGESKASKSSTKRAVLSNDLSHLPGMKIITKDGLDVTNMTSRGCKTKEQRDHAHLMRIIKACDSCRRKKVRCDPSHKRSAGSSTAKISKKTKKTAASTIPSSAPPPQQALEPLENFPHTPSFNISDEATSWSFDSTMSESLVDLTMDWNQFIHFDEEPTQAIPSDYDFFHDPQGFLSPTSYNSFSPSQPITPAQTLGVESMATGTVEGEAQIPLPPYLNPGGEAGGNYADFSLYSPCSSTGLEDDPSLSKEVAAMPHPDYFEYSKHQRIIDGRDQETCIDEDRNFDAQLAASPNVQYRASTFRPERIPPPASLGTSPYDENVSYTVYDNSGQIEQDPEWYVPVSPGGPSSVPPMNSDKPRPQPRNVPSPTEADVRKTVVNTSLTRPNAISTSLEQQEFQPGSSPSYAHAHLRITRSILTYQQSQERSVAMLTSGAGYCCPCVLAAPASPTMDPFPGSQPHQKHGWQAQSKSGPNETLALHSPIFENYGTDGTFLPLVSSSQPTQPTRFVRDTPKKTTSTYVVELGIKGAHESSNAANISAADLAAQDITISSANRQSDLLGESAPSVSLLGASNGVHLLGVLVSALTLAALHVLSLLAIGTVCQWRLFNNCAKEFETALVLTGSQLVAPASIKQRQRTTEPADMLYLSAQPLSFLRRLPFAVTNSVKLKYSQLSRGFSRNHRNFEKKINFQASDEVRGMRRLQRITSIAW